MLYLLTAGTCSDYHLKTWACWCFSTRNPYQGPGDVLPVHNSGASSRNEWDLIKWLSQFQDSLCAGGYPWGVLCIWSLLDLGSQDRVIRFVSGWWVKYECRQALRLLEWFESFSCPRYRSFFLASHLVQCALFFCTIVPLEKLCSLNKYSHHSMQVFPCRIPRRQFGAMSWRLPRHQCWMSSFYARDALLMLPPPLQLLVRPFWLVMTFWTLRGTHWIECAAIIAP